ncbi:IS6 family transposase [Spartinivicinus poritis]|uniref:IS6 family transposase n=1 Tax=Spartinivicinus poritis TaxID=2994640 RepID=A0ABT5U9F4_9GAMM|nr:IS6 family transposase [Spartinivicinus sp. A2-2]MDE1462192.1 IS6 family transposase [Spartinivicinus sp. A2-2]
MSVDERFKGCHFPKCVVLQAVYYYLRFALSYRDIEELMQDRNVPVDHSSIQRWVVAYSAKLEKSFRKKKSPVGRSWHMDETYIRVKKDWYYLYRAVDKQERTIDFLFTKHRDTKAAKRFFKKAIRANGVPEKITIDGSAANNAAIEEVNEELEKPVIIRQVKYLNNRVEQGHRFIKRMTRPMLGFKSFNSARSTLMGIELIHRLRKGQSADPATKHKTLFEKFCALAG